MSLVLQMDGGNTRLKWRLLDSDSCIVEEGVEFYSELGGAEFISRQCFIGLKKVYYASVKICESLRLVLCALEESLGKWSVVEIDHSMLSADEFAYRDFERLGIDRCLAIIGGRSLCNDACLIVDAGSAITADVLSKEGKHLGGYIFPGVSMLRESLLGGTSKIIVEGDVPHSVEPGVTTEQCVSHALDVMVKATLEFLINKFRRYGYAQIVLTGGDATYIASLIDKNIEICRGLVFEGIDRVIAGLGE